MKSKDGIMGLIVGDALGVPVEFTKREYLDKYPIKTIGKKKNKNNWLEKTINFPQSVITLG